MEKTYCKVCQINDIPHNRTAVFDINGRSVLLSRINENIYAVENRCTHMNVPLGEREIIQGEVQCPRHGGRFDIATGRATQIPAIEDLKTFPVKIENTDVYVAL